MEWQNLQPDVRVNVHVAKLVGQYELFKGFPIHLQAKAREWCCPVKKPYDYVLWKQGEPTSKVIIVLSGEVAVFIREKEKAEKDAHKAPIHPACYFSPDALAAASNANILRHCEALFSLLDPCLAPDIELSPKGHGTRRATRTARPGASKVDSMGAPAAVIGPGAILGDLGIESGTLNNCMAMVKKEAVILELSRSQYLSLMRKAVGSDCMMDMWSSTRGFLLQFPLFRSLDSSVLDLMPQEALRYLSMKKGSLIYEQGNATDNCYVLLSGHVDLQRKEAEEEDGEGLVHRACTAPLGKQGFQSTKRGSTGDLSASSPALTAADPLFGRPDDIVQGEKVALMVLGDAPVGYKKRLYKLSAQLDTSLLGEEGEVKPVSASLSSAEGAVMFGHDALGEDKEWGHSAICLEDCELLVVEAEVLKHLKRKAAERTQLDVPGQAVKVLSLFGGMLMPEPGKSSTLLKGQQKALQGVAETVHYEVLPKGHILGWQDESWTRIYILLSGEVEALSHTEGTRKETLKMVNLHSVPATSVRRGSAMPGGETPLDIYRRFVRELANRWRLMTPPEKKQGLGAEDLEEEEAPDLHNMRQSSRQTSFGSDAGSDGSSLGSDAEEDLPKDFYGWKVGKYNCPGQMIAEEALHIRGLAKVYATYRLATPCQMLSFEKAIFEDLLEKELKNEHLAMLSYRLMELCMELSFFKAVVNGNKEVLKKVVATVQHEKHPAGKILFKQGDEGEKCYIVLTGEVTVWEDSKKENDLDSERAGRPPAEPTDPSIRNRCDILSSMLSSAGGAKDADEETPRTKKHKARMSMLLEECGEDFILEQYSRPVVALGPGRLFGETALVNDAPRSASVSCSKPSEFLVMGRTEFDLILKRELLKEKEERLHFLCEFIPGFRTLPPATMEKALYSFQKQAFPRSHTFFTEGEQLDGSLLLIYCGTVDIYAAQGDGAAAGEPPPSPSSPHLGALSSRAALRNGKLLTSLLRGTAMGGHKYKTTASYTAVARSAKCEVMHVKAEELQNLPSALVSSLRALQDATASRRQEQAELPPISSALPWSRNRFAGAPLGLSQIPKPSLMSKPRKAPAVGQLERTSLSRASSAGCIQAGKGAMGKDVGGGRAAAFQGLFRRDAPELDFVEFELEPGETLALCATKPKKRDVKLVLRQSPSCPALAAAAAKTAVKAS
eukprot:TRINITY_DN3260_c0_g1_i2.p1 TRINITY_DN3260_c0_g1~~TRINITY_DN3260_c0_g1_i2.p1  ORF type:complete len:1179 (+),score=302.56 TRINITY_DN3260_c0_g1_i2:227-3763(+)